MTDRGKLIALLDEAIEGWVRLPLDEIADHLISNGVTFETGSHVCGKSEEVKELRADNKRLRDMWAKAFTELGKVKAERRWIPVTERLPGNEKVLITNGDIVMRGYRRPDGVWKYGVGLDEVWEKLSLRPVTHWMPLPEPPADMRKGENG